MPTPPEQSGPKPPYQVTKADLDAVYRLTAGAGEHGDVGEAERFPKPVYTVPARPKQETRHGVDAVLGQYQGAAEAHEDADNSVPNRQR